MKILQKIINRLLAVFSRKDKQLELPLEIPKQPEVIHPVMRDFRFNRSFARRVWKRNGKPRSFRQFCKDWCQGYEVINREF